MKKKILGLIFSVLTCGYAYADTEASIGQDLVGLNMKPELAGYLAGLLINDSVAHSIIPGTDDTYDLGSTSFSWRSIYFSTSLIAKTSAVLRVRQDAQRLFTFDGSSDTALTFKWGDGGTTATQTLSISASTADADDDSQLVLASGGASGTDRGAYIQLRGNEASSGGNVTMVSGTVASADVDLYANDDLNIKKADGTTVWSLDTATGVFTSLVTNGGGIVLANTGSTIAIDSGTAASACKGTGTFNGTTAVTVTTTCASTSQHVSITPTSDPAGATAAYCWTTNIVNGTSFDVDCDQANDGTFSWVIIKEG